MRAGGGGQLLRPRRHTVAASRPQGGRSLSATLRSQGQSFHTGRPRARWSHLAGGDTEAPLGADLHTAAVLPRFFTLCLECSLGKEQRAVEQVYSSLQTLTWRHVMATPSVCSGCCHKTPGLGSRPSITSPGSGGWKPEISVPPDSVPGERPPPGQQSPPHYALAGGQRSYKDTNLTRRIHPHDVI